MAESGMAPTAAKQYRLAVNNDNYEDFKWVKSVRLGK